MLFYKIRPQGGDYIQKPYWVRKSENQHGEIWENMSGGWCLKNVHKEISSA